MNRYERIIEILDDAVGGRDKFVNGRHGAFWRHLSHSAFLTYEFLELRLVVPGNSADSNLVRSLRGQDPFVPGKKGRGRMPLRGRPVPEDRIAEIARWIDEGCPEKDATEEPAATTRTWAPTAAPRMGAKARYNDVWFVNETRGWAINYDGQILATDDGFATPPEEQFHNENIMPRCLGFASPTLGWVGFVDAPADLRLLRTTDGTNWEPIENLPPGSPEGICGLSVVNESVVAAAGTNYPYSEDVETPPPAFVRTDDGGRSWTAVDMRPYASCLIDVLFTTPEKGWVVGGVSDSRRSGGELNRDNVRPVVLYTEDGGRTWTDRAAPIRESCSYGEWGWKIQFLKNGVGYVALQNFTEGAILKTTDGGLSWRRLPVKDKQGNVNFEGIGFIDADRGWVSGWGTGWQKGVRNGESSATVDGGATWTDANEIGRFINRFRFLGDPVTVGYAAGDTIYKYADHSVRPPALAAAPGPVLLRDDIVEADGGRRVDIPITVPRDARTLHVAAWEEFGRGVGVIVEEAEPAPGPRTVAWDTSDRAGGYIVRVTVDGVSESQVVVVGP